ncbi:ABC transporter ATP-binding protein [Nemorincola caseinilytica]|uniref:ABC transporter ATP-binding protein n=1 Tax=Nemorincola caseinilytica TaxID=2054315 RepID=A0ABP8NBV1_9BACT
MKDLRSLNKYFIKYKWRLSLGLLFVAISSKFAVMPGNVIQQMLDKVVAMSAQQNRGEEIFGIVLQGGLLLLGLALLRGLFMFMMRQTIIVMSRHIEFDQKNEIYAHYQRLHTAFFKANFTGDLMNRISEDVSRVRMYTGPSIMYFTSVVFLVIFCVWDMLRVDVWLTVCVVAPLPLLALSIFYVNKIIHRKSSRIQAQLSALTTTAQESYSGIRVIKSFVQERNMMRFFETTSEQYRKSSIDLSLTEAVYFPAMNLFIGFSMLSTVLIGGYFAINGQISTGNIAQFVIYINLLMFPISSIGMVASMTQRAGASQARIDEFLHTKPAIVSPANGIATPPAGDVHFNDISFTYPHTGITALRHFSLHVKAGEKVAIIGRTGSGKSTLAHMLLRMYDTTEGALELDGHNVNRYDLDILRGGIAYAPQEAYLFSDTILNNIRFGRASATEAEVKEAARMADLDKDIAGFQQGYETVVGERGVMLSGGQKQRMVLARALLKKSNILLLDECLSAVDTQTEKTILNNLGTYLQGKTVLVITHRIFTSWAFDKIIILDNGNIAEQGTHDELMALDGRYAKLYRHQTEVA